MITYKILEKTDNEVTFQIEDSTQWLLKKEKDIKIKTLSITEANEFFNKIKTQRQTQFQLLTERINTEIESLNSILTSLK